MVYSASIIVNGDSEKLEKCFATEQIEYARSSVTLNKQKEFVEFKITSKDAVSLRATLNSVSQLLIIYETVAKGRKK